MAYVDRGFNSGGGRISPTSAEFARAGIQNDCTLRPARHPQHSVLFYEGDKAERVYELDEGVVMLFKLLPDGRRQVVEILNAGSVFGLSAGEVYDCSAESLTPVKVSTLDRNSLETSPSLQRHVTRCLLSQLETLHDHAVLLGRKSAMERVSTFLMRLVPNRGGFGCVGPTEEAGEDSRSVTLHMTRQEIADYLGLTIETVSRVISEMKRKGLICIDRQDQIRIVNICRVCQMTGMH
ncbi:helix-turn-helix domain-containing protein [Rhizobiales bacterium]|uniref:Crp/Fnr family transcriptional regulator n=1 Tax=Hongsoonwoonella zoysiae TaxID=2821844 RepID=UPI0015614023|nr:helix-turn-helix domain-containing protein [Hongsoonwoonella zoysiae]NRG19576.1 helix-turn-helix domain-containing protein [Hongsoonwoonella zoysiae]